MITTNQISPVQEQPHIKPQQAPVSQLQPQPQSPQVISVPQKLLRCPNCNSTLRISYSCTPFTLGWSIFLLIGLTCWVPCVVDACKKAESHCLTCDQIVQVYEPQCC